MSSKSAASSLTKREQEILVLIGKGQASAQIAEALFVSLHTVSAHRKNLCRKLQLHTTAALAAFAATNFAS